MSYTRSSPLRGRGTVSASAIQAWFVSRGPAYKGYAPNGQYEPPPPNLGSAIVQECCAYSTEVLNHDLLAAQILHETAAWQSEYARERNNPGGIGAINSDPDQALWYATPEEGVRCHVAHMLNYVAGRGPWSVDDPRGLPNDYYGIVDVLRELEQRWAWSPPAEYLATPADQRYGGMIAKHANVLVAYAATQPEEPSVGTPYDHIIPGMIDARSQLSTATQGQGGALRGPYETIGLGAKRGVVVHYRGVVTDPGAGLSSYKSDAAYHVGKNWASAGQTPILGSGIMYHIGVDGQGKVYLLRDLERVLWHCGAWPQNENTLAIQLPLGGDQHATGVQLDQLKRVVNDWLAFSHAPRAEVWGHKQLSPTPCPGTLMADFIQPFHSAPPPVESMYFPETGYTVGGGFLRAWEADGGLKIFGYPISEERVENNMTVQWFERARFEHHPGAWPEHWDTMYGLLGVEAMGAS